MVFGLPHHHRLFNIRTYQIYGNAIPSHQNLFAEAEFDKNFD